MYVASPPCVLSVAVCGLGSLASYVWRVHRVSKRRLWSPAGRSYDSIPGPRRGQSVTDRAQASTGLGQCYGEWLYDPIVIGGVSGSGTRGLVQVMRELYGVSFCQTYNTNLDDVILMGAIGKVWALFSHSIGVFGRPESNTPSTTGYDLALLMLDQSELDFVHKIICDAVIEDWICAGRPAGLWGFKVPRSITAVAMFKRLLPRHLFVHATRDPRATCTPTSNLVSYNSMCHGITGRVCRSLTDTPYDCYLYWARSNLYAHRVYSESGRSRSDGAQRIQVRIEDLVAFGMGGAARQRDIFFQLGRFFEQSVSPSRLVAVMEDERLHAKACAEKPYANSALAIDAWRRLVHDLDFKSAMAAMGYDVAVYGKIG